MNNAEWGKGYDLSLNAAKGGHKPAAHSHRKYRMVGYIIKRRDLCTKVHGDDVAIYVDKNTKTYIQRKWWV